MRSAFVRYGQQSPDAVVGELLSKAKTRADRPDRLSVAAAHCSQSIRFLGTGCMTCGHSWAAGAAR